MPRRTQRLPDVLASLPVVLVALAMLATPPAASAAAPVPEPATEALVSIERPAPGDAAALLADGVAVVRDLERYLLAFVPPADVPGLRADGWEVRLLAEPGPDRTYYTVTPAEGPFLDAAPGARVLRADAWDAVLAATPDEAERIAEAGGEIARVFPRAIRVRDRADVVAPRALREADPRIQALVDAVDGARVDASVQRLQDFVTRYATHDSCQAAADWIQAQFESFGIDSVYQHSFSSTYKPNVVAVIPGRADPSVQVVIGGHYDSITSNHANCPGADDDASGTACVLECARVLAGTDFDYTVIFIAFGAEELGLIGSEAYADAAAARGDDILAAIAVDMIGYVAPGDARDLDVIDNASSLWLRDLAFSTAAEYVPEHTIVDGAIPGGASSDHASFWAQGYDAILFFEDTGNYSPYIHTVNDVVGTSYNDPIMAERSVRCAAGLVATLARPFDLAIVHDPLSDTEDTTAPYPVEATIVSAGTLDPGAIEVHWSAGGAPSTVAMVPAGPPDAYTAQIPAQSGGTWVEYWISAADDGGHEATHPEGAPGNVHRFFVGQITAFVLDECEAATGWTAGVPGDDATTGLWEHGDPNGTINGTYFVQPEDDHTPAPGVACWVTGNQVAASHGSDDVDGGRTTLVTPTYDLSGLPNAHVRYWRWFTNDTGSAPGEDIWKVDGTSDGGTTWIPIERDVHTAREWTLVDRDLAGVLDLTSTVAFRFVASDSGAGSIVEAAVDDFSIVTYEVQSTAVEPAGAVAGAVTLARPAPNPFLDRTAIRFTIPGGPRPATVGVYDLAGRRVVRLLDEPVSGARVVWWDGTDGRGGRVASGVYWIRLRAGEETATQRVVHMR